MEMINQIFLTPGDIVIVKHDIENRPRMFVVEKVSRNIRNSGTNEIQTLFVGMKCRWFNANGDLQEAIFNTKDLELVK